MSEKRLGDFYLRRGDPGDAEQALGCFERSLQTRQSLLERNPGSAQAARDVSVSQWKCFQAAHQVGKQDESISYLTRCFSMLDQFQRQGRPMDVDMRTMYQHLLPMSSSDSTDPNQLDPGD